MHPAEGVYDYPLVHLASKWDTTQEGTSPQHLPWQTGCLLSKQRRRASFLLTLGSHTSLNLWPRLRWEETLLAERALGNKHIQGCEEHFILDPMEHTMTSL